MKMFDSSTAICWKDYPLSIISPPEMYGSVSGLYSVSLIYMYILTPTSGCLDYCNFIEIPIKFFFKVVLAIPDSFHFHIKLKSRLSISSSSTKKHKFFLKKTYWNIDWNCTKVLSQFGENCHLNIESGNPMDREARQVTVHGVTQEWGLSI